MNSFDSQFVAPDERLVAIEMCGIPSPYIVNLVPPCRLPIVGVIFVTRPPER